MHHLRRLRLSAAALLVFPLALVSAHSQMAVRHTAGALRGFLEIRTQSGARLGYAEVNASVIGELVTNHMIYHFTDGSIDDEVTVFRQGKTFQFVSDHHVQRGRFFPKPSDITVEASGQVTTRTTGKDGKVKVDTTHIDLGPDFTNGMVGTILQNVSPNSGEFKLSLVVPTPKPRAIKLDVTRDGQQSFHIVGSAQKATVFRLKIELGGIVGVIAPMVGKQPADILISVVEGETPCIVRIQQSLAEDTPPLDIQLAGTSFPRK